MEPFIAQLSEVEVCGEGADAKWLCQVLYRATGNDLVARASGALSTLIAIVVILVGAWVLNHLLRRVVSRFAARMEQKIERRLTRSHESGALTRSKRYRTRRLQRLKAITGVLRGVVAVIVWLSAILLAIAVAGIRLQPILAGAGLVGIVVGFGAQQLVRDVLAGIAMLIEDQYGVGDFIEIDGVVGEVERVGLRRTALRDVDGVVHHVLNGSVQRVGNLSQEWATARFDVPVALDADVASVKALLYEVAQGLADDPVWGDDIIAAPEIWGVQDFGPHGLSIRVVIPTKPLRNWDVTRQLRERIKFALEQAHVRMPGQLIEVGGQPTGYAMLTREIRGQQDTEAQRQGQGRAAGAPFAAAQRPKAGQGPARTGMEAAATEVDKNPTGDLTTELRIEQGPRARPD